VTGALRGSRCNGSGGALRQRGRGGSLYRKSSFLLDCIGAQVFTPEMTIREEPQCLEARHRRRSTTKVSQRSRETLSWMVSSRAISWELFRAQARSDVDGQCGGNHNLMVSHGDDDLDALLKKMGRGLLVTELLGQGVNPVTGDYSRGAAGYWVEGGQVAYPVEEITIAGNLSQMYRDIVAIGKDVDRRGHDNAGRC
jgi:PmbA protein